MNFAQIVVGFVFYFLTLFLLLGGATVIHKAYKLAQIKEDNGLQVFKTGNAGLILWLIAAAFAIVGNVLIKALD